MEFVNNSMIDKDKIFDTEGVYNMTVTLITSGIVKALGYVSLRFYSIPISVEVIFAI